MTLFQVINIFKDLALSTPNIRSASEGSVYDKLNTNNSIEYDVFHITQTTHTEDFETDYYGLTLFYISRLEDSLEDNRLQIQSIGKEVLGNIIRTFCDNFSVDFPDITYIPFTQRFTDLCAGIYCNIRIEIPKELICPDNYLTEVIPGSGIRLQDLGITITQNGLRVVTPDFPYDGIGEIRIDVQVPQTAGKYEDKEVTYTENGVYTIYPDSDYDAMTSVQVEVDVPDMYEEGYNAGEAAGEENQKAKLVSTSFTENNTYTRENGYSAVTVNVPSRYDEGKEDGVAEQKAKLSALTVTLNGEYRREDGYSAITVNVPQTGSTINNQTKSFRFDSGNTVIEKSELVGGGLLLRGKEAYTVTPDSGYTGLDSVAEELFINVTPVYMSGYSEGFEQGMEDGKEWQKHLLVSTSFTENNTYTREDGYSAVTVNVPDRYNEGYSDGYNSGVTDGEAAQKAKLISTAITANGIYNREDGYNTLYVNVPDRDLIANLQGDYFVIPEGTTRLRDYAFYNQCFSSITIPNTVTAIGEFAFTYNDCLTSITIPDSVTGIGQCAFQACGNLVSAYIGSGLTEIPRYTFAINDNLTGITIPASVTGIGQYAFMNDTGLTEMTFEGLVPPTINTGNSLGSTAYTFPIYVPCESLDTYKTAFGTAYAPRIQCAPTPPTPPEPNYRTLDFVYTTTEANQIVKLFKGDAQNDSAHFWSFYDYLLGMQIDGAEVAKSESNISYTQPDAAYYWHSFPTSGTHNVRYYVEKDFTPTYPPATCVLSIFDEPGNTAHSLTSVVVGEGYQYVKYLAFQNDVLLTGVTLPSTLLGIEKNAFNDCTGLTTVTVNATTPPTIPTTVADDIFRHCSSLQNIYVPAASVDTYKAAAGWSVYANRITAITT